MGGHVVRRRSKNVVAAIIVSSALFVGAVATPAASSVRAAGGGKSVTLNALFVRESPQGSTGGTNPVTIHLRQVGGKVFRVGFTEDEVAGSGDQWRAAGWNAATVATLLTGSSLGGNEITFDV